LFKNTLQIIAAQTLYILGIKNLNLAFGGVFLFKKFIAALLCFSLIMTPTVFSTPVEASPPSGITPLWDIANSVILGMSRNNVVSWYGDITGGPQCYSISAVYTLQGPNCYYTWGTGTVYGWSSYYSGSYAGGPGTYTLSVSAVVTSNTGATETVYQQITRTLS
jgi:hypothetical protein